MEALLDATVRTTIGKNEARRTRREGKVPAVVYGAASQGGSREAVAIAVDPKPLLKILHSEAGANTLISLRLDGTDTKVLVKDFLLEPITHQVLHVDFYRVAMDRRIEVTIPVLLKGEPKGVKLQGGLLEFIRREIQIECLPSDIPEHVDVDVSELMVGQGIRVRDVATNPKWRSLTDTDTMLVHVIIAKAEEAATPAAGEAAPTAGSEPEVIKKGKKEEGEAEKKK
ncbi:MAG TPA: 50S ribosomal protein L25 [Vicinamibacterales bacterium]|nr:50S ribosomal protein L25 [Vicinamibacterales bacterium]